MTTGKLQKPIPKPTPLTKPFWDGTAQGKFLMQRCTRCGKFNWSPRPNCRHCLSEAMEWTQIKGTGEVYSFVVMHRAATPAFDAPYTVALIKVDEGPVVWANVVGVDPELVTIGMKLKVDFELVDDAGKKVGLFAFRPA